MANISAIKLPDGVTYNIKDDVSGYITGMTILSYGSSTWQNFIDAYDVNKVVYCRASSNSNPATGSQTRLAFMAYVNNATTPTEVEFQYYRSVSSHSASQQGDQVYVYKLNKSTGWSVTTREAYTKMVVNNGITSSYTTGTSASMTISLADAYGDTKNPYGTKTANYVLAGPTSGSAAAPSFRALVAADIPDLSSTYLTDAKVDGVSVVTNGIAEINSEIYYVKITDTGDGYISDKTYAEIRQAALDGKQIIVYNYQEEPEDNYSECKFFFLDSSWYEGDAGGMQFRRTYAASDECVFIYPDDESDNTVVEVESTYGIRLNGSEVYYADFYAPTTVGTNGYVLQSNGIGTPSWVSASLTDEKVSTAAVTGGFTYYPVVGSNTTSAETKYYDDKGFSYVSTQGGSDYSGSSVLNLGSSSNAGSADGRYGELRIYSGDGKYISIRNAGTVTINKSITLPNKSGTIALTSDIPTVPNTTGSVTTGISIADHSTDSIYGVSSSTTSVYGVSTSTTTASKVTVGSHSTDYGVTAAGSGSASLTFAMDTTDTKKLVISFSHTHTAPTLGSKVPTVSASDVTVPIKNADATTVPIKNVSATTVVTSATHSVTDNGHTHTI